MRESMSNVACAIASNTQKIQSSKLAQMTWCVMTLRNFPFFLRPNVISDGLINWLYVNSLFPCVCVSSLGVSIPRYQQHHLNVTLKDSVRSYFNKCKYTLENCQNSLGDSSYKCHVLRCC